MVEFDTSQGSQLSEDCGYPRIFELLSRRALPLKVLAFGCYQCVEAGFVGFCYDGVRL